MKKTVKFALTGVVALAMVCVGILIADKHALRSELVRLHVVANSDSDEDQAVKMVVRDAIVTYLYDNMQDISNVQEAKTYLHENLNQLEELANQTLKAAGVQEQAQVCLTREPFGTRVYDTFTLPSGVYETLRVNIGEAEGKNWWCVVFPSLCMPTSTQAFRDTAVSSGFSQGLTDTLSGKEDYKIRFFLLDCLGKLENLFFSG